MFEQIQYKYGSYRKRVGDAFLKISSQVQGESLRECLHSDVRGRPSIESHHHTLHHIGICHT